MAEGAGGSTQARAPAVGGASGLGILDLASLFQALAANRRTGTLRVSGGAAGEAYVYFLNGCPRLADSAQPDSSLAEDAVVKARLLSRDDLRALREEARRTRRSPAAVLLSGERVPLDQLRGLLVRQILERCSEVMTWKSVQCEFFADQVMGLDEDLAGFSPGIPAEGILLETARRQDEWKRIRAAFEPASDVFEAGRAPESAGDARRELLGLVDGYRDAQEIAAASSLNAFECCRELHDMLELGLVRTAGTGDLARIGDLAVAEGDWAKALRLFRRAYEKDASRVDLLAKLAAACEGLGDVAGAREHLLAFAARCMEASRFGEAVRACRRLVELAPDDAECRARLFRALLATNERGELRACGLGLADLHEKARAVERAAEVLARLRELFPDDTEIGERSARVRLAAAERTEALVEYEKVAESYMERGDLEAAVRAFRKIVEEIDEECLEARIHLAECLIKLERPDEAIAEYQKLAAILSRTGVIDEVASMPFMLRVNRRIAEIDPMNVASREWLAETYAGRRDRRSSLEVFDQLLAIHEDSGDRGRLIAALRRIGELFPDELGYRERLAEAYAADRETHPKAQAELVELCRIAWETEEFVLGVRVANRLLALNPFHMPAHILLGEAMLAREDRAGAVAKLLDVSRGFITAGLHGDAEEVLRAILRVDEGSAEARRLLAGVLAEHGDPEEAAANFCEAGIMDLAEKNYGLAGECFRRALRLKPDDVRAQQLLKQLPRTAAGR